MPKPSALQSRLRALLRDVRASQKNAKKLTDKRRRSRIAGVLADCEKRLAALLETESGKAPAKPRPPLRAAPKAKPKTGAACVGRSTSSTAAAITYA